MENHLEENRLEYVLDTVRRNLFFQKNGIQVEMLSEEKVVLKMELKEWQKNPYGMAHGGVLYTMSDCCAGTLARTDGRGYVTLDADMHYLHSGMSGEITAVGRVIHRGKQTTVIESECVDDQGKVLTKGTFTMFCVNRN